MIRHDELTTCDLLKSAPGILRTIRILLALFITGLVLSGITAFPLQQETHYLARFLNLPAIRAIAESTGLLNWIRRVNYGLTVTDARFPFLAYGTDWLAFAHLVIAVAFIGPYIDPARNKWVVTFGLIACLGVIPLALIAGPIRGIPIGWRSLDCSFGLFGSIPLIFCWRLIADLERAPE